MGFKGKDFNADKPRQYEEARWLIGDEWQLFDVVWPS